ncbi:MAG: type IV pilus assembly protein PilM [Candidatus Rokubacteria bacterium]|nr:type IV pilus assembly protein PilM [Candidatus Rokubacteria bacterium]
MGLFPTEKLAGLFKKKQDVLGLDVGSSAVKLVQLGLGPKGYLLQAMAIVPLPPEAISEGAIKDPPLVVTAIKEAVTKAGVKEKDAVIAVSGRELSVQKFQLQKVPPKERDGFIRIQAEGQIPFPIAEVYFDYQIVAESPEETGTMDVMLVAAKQSKVNEYVAVVEGAGLTPLVVDLDSFALQNQFEINNPDLLQEVVALIDVGASMMKTNVVRGGTSIFARDIPFGGDSYTQAIAERLSVPLDKAEAVKRRADESVNWDEVAPALEEVSRELSLEMQRTFDYIASSTEAEQISRIVLSGGCAKLAGLDEFLASSWGIPVEISKPFQNVEFDPARFPAEELEAAGPLLAVAVGLGMRRPGDKAA